MNPFKRQSQLAMRKEIKRNRKRFSRLAETCESKSQFYQRHLDAGTTVADKTPEQLLALSNYFGGKADAYIDAARILGSLVPQSEVAE